MGAGPNTDDVRPRSETDRSPGTGERGEGKQDGGQADVALVFLFQMGTTTTSFSGRWITPSWWPTPSGCSSGTQVLRTPFPPCRAARWRHHPRRLPTAFLPPSAVGFLGSASPCATTCRGGWCWAGSSPRSSASATSGTSTSSGTSSLCRCVRAGGRPGSGFYRRGPVFRWLLGTRVSQFPSQAFPLHAKPGHARRGRRNHRACPSCRAVWQCQPLPVQPREGCKRLRDSPGGTKKSPPCQAEHFLDGFGMGVAIFEPGCPKRRRGSPGAAAAAWRCLSLARSSTGWCRRPAGPPSWRASGTGSGRESERFSGVSPPHPHPCWPRAAAPVMPTRLSPCQERFDHGHLELAHLRRQHLGVAHRRRLGFLCLGPVLHRARCHHRCRGHHLLLLPRGVWVAWPAGPQFFSLPVSKHFWQPQTLLPSWWQAGTWSRPPRILWGHPGRLSPCAARFSHPIFLGNLWEALWDFTRVFRWREAGTRRCSPAPGRFPSPTFLPPRHEMPEGAQAERGWPGLSRDSPFSLQIPRTSAAVRLCITWVESIPSGLVLGWVVATEERPGCQVIVSETRATLSYHRGCSLLFWCEHPPGHVPAEKLFQPLAATLSHISCFRFAFRRPPTRTTLEGWPPTRRIPKRSPPTRGRRAARPTAAWIAPTAPRSQPRSPKPSASSGRSGYLWVAGCPLRRDGDGGKSKARAAHAITTTGQKTGGGKKPPSGGGSEEEAPLMSSPCPRAWWSFLSACSLPSWWATPSSTGCPSTLSMSVSFLGTGRQERAWQGEHLLTPPLSLAAHFSAKEAGDLSTLFDVGGIIGLSHTWVEGVDRGWFGDNPGFDGKFPPRSAVRFIQHSQHLAGSKRPSFLFHQPGDHRNPFPWVSLAQALLFLR